MTTPDKPMQGLAHPCNNVTAHRGGVFICQAKGGRVGADSFCMGCPIVKYPASLADVDAATPASAAEAVPVTPDEIAAKLEQMKRDAHRERNAPGADPNVRHGQRLERMAREHGFRTLAAMQAAAKGRT